MIELKGVSKTYKAKKGVDTKALNNINLKLDNKCLVFIVGKSGSGKSTLLNLLGGLDTPDKGNIFIDNVDICKLSNKELDLYRNSYVGFIFQEFNLLNEFNVEENIDISLKLQNIEDKNKINEILKSVDLKNLNNRNINELSGGQKQRVSIARALIKKPKLILADEPTGNLDRKSSDQVFSILKDISKNELVVVVSHDIESANIYADRIIRIEDGKIVDDNQEKEIKKNENVVNFTNSKMPLSYILKMAYSYIMNKPFRLVMTILLTMLSLSFMCFAINVYLFDGNALHIDTINKNNEYSLNIDYREIIIDTNESRDEKKLKINDENISYLKDITKSTINPEYTLYENGKSIRFEFGSKTEEFEDNEAFDYLPSNFKFVELNDNRIVGKIIGSYPKDNNEVLVHKYFADYLINFGIRDSENELYFANNYDEIVNSNHLIKLSNHNVKIVGIVDDDKHLFERGIKSGEFWSNDLKRFYNENYSIKSAIVYVNKKFINDINLENELDLSNIDIRCNNIHSSNETKQLTNEIEYIDLNGDNKKIDYLNEDEIIISLDTLRNYVDEYNFKLEDYLKNNSSLSYNELIKNYTISFVKENDLNINIDLIDRSLDNEKKTNMKLVGISLEDYNYISNDYKGINDNLKSISSVFVYVTDNKILKNLFNELTVMYDESYFLPGNKFFISYDNSLRVSSVIYVYSIIKKYLLSLSLIFIGFTSLLILNFISNSISSYKKEIGILRSIGTKSIDIVKLFGIETLLIALLSWIFGIIVWLVQCYLLNDSIFGNLYFILDGILINPLVPIIVLVFNFIISLLITIILIDKINKVKPIEVILDR